MDELKQITGIDEAVQAFVINVNGKKEEVLARISDLADIITTAENLAERKKDRAAVNKERKALDDERKEVEKKWKSAMDPVSKAYKDAVAECDKVIKAIDKGLDEFEQKRIAEKEEVIRGIWECIPVPEELTGWLNLIDVFNPKWLNATYKESEIRRDIEEEFSLLEIGMNTIKSMKHKYEQEGLIVLKQTRSLQQAITKMSELLEQELIIKEKEAIQDARKKIAESGEGGKIPYKKPEVFDSFEDLPFGMPEPVKYNLIIKGICADELEKLTQILESIGCDFICQEVD